MYIAQFQYEITQILRERFQNSQHKAANAVHNCCSIACKTVCSLQQLNRPCFVCRVSAA